MYFSWSGGPKPLAPHNSCFADAPAGQASLALQTTQVVVMITMMVIMMGMGMMMMMVVVVVVMVVVDMLVENHEELTRKGGVI